jgi:hypothetical protein
MKRQNIGTETRGGSGRKSLSGSGVGVLALLLLIAIGSAALAVRQTEKSASVSVGINSAAPVGRASTEKVGIAQTGAELPASGNHAISAPISGTCRMKASAVNRADNSQMQEQSRTGLLKVVEQAGDKLKFALNAETRGRRIQRRRRYW